MRDMKILVHIKAVRAAIFVNFVTTMIHSEAYESIVIPIVFDQLAEHGESATVGSHFGESLYAFGTFLVHYAVIVAIVYTDEIVFIL